MSHLLPEEKIHLTCFICKLLLLTVPTHCLSQVWRRTEVVEQECTHTHTHTAESRSGTLTLISTIWFNVQPHMNMNTNIQRIPPREALIKS